MQRKMMSHTAETTKRDCANWQKITPKNEVVGKRWERVGEADGGRERERERERERVE